MSGTPYTTEIEQAIKERSVLFCAFVSKATEGDPTRYVHRERQWAAERHVSGRLYYMPFILDLPLDKRPKLEPERVSTVHYDRLSGLDPEHFAARVRVQLANKMRQIHA
jgi:hypothetical protein